MDASDRKIVASHPRLAAALFYLVSLLLFPVTLLGYLIWIVKGILGGRNSGVSGTAQGPLSARYTQHRFGVRPDEPASRLMTALPGVPPLGLRLSTGPTFFANRLTGYVPKAFRYPFQGEISIQVEASARQTFFDTVVDRHLPALPQFVILGAGFDTRLYRLPPGSPVRSFEVDAPQTQAVKRALLEQVAIDTTGVTFVSADFARQDWLARLVEAGFDPSQPALFLWEGVIMYLDRPAVESSLRRIASTAPGSLVAFDYYTSEILESQSLYMRFARFATRAAGEPLRFGVDSTPPSRDRLDEFLRACGLALLEQRTLGSETAGQRAWGGFAIAVVK